MPARGGAISTAYTSVCRNATDPRTWHAAIVCVKNANGSASVVVGEVGGFFGSGSLPELENSPLVLSARTLMKWLKCTKCFLLTRQTSSNQWNPPLVTLWGRLVML